MESLLYPDGYDKQSKHGLRKRVKIFHFGGWPSPVHWRESKDDPKAGDWRRAGTN